MSISSLLLCISEVNTYPVNVPGGISSICDGASSIDTVLQGSRLSIITSSTNSTTASFFVRLFNGVIIPDSDIPKTVTIFDRNIIVALEAITAIMSFTPNLLSVSVFIISSRCMFVGEVVTITSMNIPHSHCDVTSRVTNFDMPNMVFIDTTRNEVERQDAAINIGSDSNKTLSTNSPNTMIINNAVIVGTVSGVGRFSYTAAFNNDRNQVLQLYFNSVLSLPAPPSEPNHNFCTNPIITILSLTQSNFNKDILEVVIDVADGIFHFANNGSCYKECLSPINNGTRFTIFLLFINCVLINPSQVTLEIQLYAVLKLILARLLFDELNIKWLCRHNYCELYNKVACSRFNSFIPILNVNVDLEVFFC